MMAASRRQDGASDRPAFKAKVALAAVNGGIISLVREHDGAWAEMVEQRVSDLLVVRLPSGQTEPDREPLRVDDVDLGRKTAA